MWHQTRLLIVEDDEVTGFLAHRVAVDSGLFDVVDWVLNGAEALQMPLESYDLIVLDLDLPVMNGREFLIRFSERFNASDAKSQAPAILILSNANELESLQLEGSSSVVGFSLKPLSVELISRYLASVR